MKQLKLYIQSALYNIRHNPAYASFFIGGTALSFIFVTIALQITSIMFYKTPPNVNSKRIVLVSCWDQDKKGQYIARLDKEGITNLMKYVKNYETYSFIQMQPMTFIVNEQMRSNVVHFVNADYWKIYKFNFIEGRPFTETDYHTPVLVISASCAKLYFKNGSAINQKIEFQGNTFQVIGVVEDFSMLAMGGAHSVWAPYTFNKFFPNMTSQYELHVLFPENFTPEQMSQNVVDALRRNAETQHMEVDIDTSMYPNDYSLRMDQMFNGILTYGIPIVIFLLLIIPAINIITLSIANTANRAEEIAIRRALGADKSSAFFQSITEYIILVFLGTCLGLLLVYPVFYVINNIFIEATPVSGFTLFPELNISVVLLGVLPLAMLFSLLSGGLPAYLIAKKNIANTLKGGSK